MRLRRWPAAARADPTSSPATGSRSAPPTATAAASASTGAATWDGATVSERARGPNGPNGLRAPHCPPAPLTVPPRPVRRRGCRPGGARPPPPPPRLPPELSPPRRRAAGRQRGRLRGRGGENPGPSLLRWDPKLRGCCRRGGRAGQRRCCRGGAGESCLGAWRPDTPQLRAGGAAEG